MGLRLPENSGWPNEQRKMPIIHRYIFKELTKTFLITVAFLTALLYLERLIYMTSLIFIRGVNFWEIASMMIYISPAFLSITIPMGIMMASVLVFNRFSADSEIHAMKASGWSFLYLMRPVILFSLLAFLVSNLIIFYALPLGNQALEKTIFNIVRNKANFDIKPNVFNKDFFRLVLFVKGKKSDTKLNDIFVSQRIKDNVSKTAFARQGTIVTDPDNLKIQLRLKEGTIHIISQENKNYQTINFDRYDITLELPGLKRIHQGLVGNREKSYNVLREEIKNLKKEGKPTSRLEMVISKKFALPVACLLFGLIGAPLGIKSSRAGKSGGYAMGAFLLGAYFIGLVLMQNLGSSGIVNPYFSVWVPNILFFFMAVIITHKTQYEIPFRVMDMIFDQITDLEIQIRRFFLKLTQPNIITAPDYTSLNKTDADIHKASREILKRKLKSIKSQKTVR